MGLIHNIYTAPIVCQVSCGPECLVVIKYNNRTYDGCAITHPDDEEFFSEKVGYSIALSRARIQILKDEKERLRQEYINKMRLYNDVLGYGAKKPEEIDPTGAFKKNIDKTLHRYFTIIEALKEEQEGLKTYLEGQNTFIEKLKAYRKRTK